ncbi:MAG: Rieske (2Fe-2S) protein [Acidimicrobiia bacterium]|nr:Rieske (2Fe-2S) protein [Acidimicrobiia bacterium]
MAWYELAVPATDPQEGAVHACLAAGVPILLVGNEGRWWGIEDRCSHADCSFSTDGEVDGLVVICNCHGSEFDVRTGAVLAAPATDPLRVLPLRRTAGRLEVEL